MSRQNRTKQKSGLSSGRTNRLESREGKHTEIDYSREFWAIVQEIIEPINQVDDRLCKCTNRLGQVKFTQSLEEHFQSFQECVTSYIEKKIIAKNKAAIGFKLLIPVLSEYMARTMTSLLPSENKSTDQKTTNEDKWQPNPSVTSESVDVEIKLYEDELRIDMGSACDVCQIKGVSQLVRHIISIYDEWEQMMKEHADIDTLLNSTEKFKSRFNEWWNDENDFDDPATEASAADEFSSWTSRQWVNRLEDSWKFVRSTLE